MMAGDWVLCEFEVKEIKRMDGGRITEVSDGDFSTSSYDLSDVCFPLTGRGNSISEHFRYAYRDLHALGSLNYPDIHRYLVATWCRAMREDSPDALKAVLAMPRAMVEAARSALQARHDGVWLFRRKP